MGQVRHKHIVVILITLLVLLLVFMLSNSIFLKSLLQVNCINADDKDGAVIAKLTWDLDGYKVTILGDGNMSEYTPKAWSEQLKDMSYGWKIPIRKVMVKEGVTSISAGLFSGCSKLEYVCLPRSIEKIGIKAFAYCGELYSIVYQGTLDEWHAVMDQSPLWCEDSCIISVTCLDGVFAF